MPSGQPSTQPSEQPSGQPSSAPSGLPSSQPSQGPSESPSNLPTMPPDDCDECELVGNGSNCDEVEGSTPGRNSCCTASSGGLRCQPNNGRDCGPGRAENNFCDNVQTGLCTGDKVCCKNSNQRGDFQCLTQSECDALQPVCVIDEGAEADEDAVFGKTAVVGKQAHLLHAPKPEDGEARRNLRSKRV